MRRRFVATAAAVFLFASLLAPTIAHGQEGGDLASYVDPLIGTYPPGFVNPGPALPHGLVGVGPDTEGPFNFGGYHYVNNAITGFSHIHMSAGVPRGGQIPLMPVSGPVQLGDEPSRVPGAGEELSPVPSYSSPFSHAREVAEAGYYKVTLERYATTVELTATTRAGMHRYTYPAGREASVVIDPTRDLTGYRTGAIAVDEEGWVTGHVDAELGVEVYFAARFDIPFTSAQTFSGTTTSDDRSAAGGRVGAILSFADAPVVQAKVGISYVDVEGARRNAEGEIDGWDFERVAAAARRSWNDALGAIEVDGATEEEKTSFYTALYHAQLFPNVVSDLDGRYVGFDDVVRTSDRSHYSQFSLWDSYRGQNQLLSVIDPPRYRDMVLSLLDMHRQGGNLPRWTFANKDPAHMSGDPVIPFIGEAWCRGGLADLSVAEADELFAAMQALTERRPARYDELGYAPVREPDPPGNVIESGGRETGTTLEYGIAEFALSLMADSADRAAERGALTERSLYHRNLLDPDTRWIRPRHDSGAWLEPFAPENDYGFQEGTSWQYSWLAMHDLRGLFDRMGGNTQVQDRLDVFFNLPATGTVPIVWPKVQNQATAFGLVYRGNQYAPGNEHDLQTPFLYNYAGAPWKTQAVARGAASLFTATPDGLPGNDDLGALSGWLVWTMLGIYPITPGAPLYTIASPVFTNATIHSPYGNIRIAAPAASAVAKFVDAVRLDGAPLERTYVTHDEITGATLRFDMSAVPNRTWGAGDNSIPPSISTDGHRAFGCEVLSDTQPIPTTIALELAGKGSRTQLMATLTETSGAAVGGAMIDFAADGVGLCSIATDAAGRAVCDVEPRYQGGHHIYTAVFAGNASHAEAAAEYAT